MTMMLQCFWSLGPAVLAFFLLSLGTNTADAAEQPRFDSKIVTTATKGHAVDVDVDVSGAKRLYLVVTDAGNGLACDWADWAEPRFVGKDGDDAIKLTDLKWKRASAGWGKVRINRNADGGPLKIAGQAVPFGIGTHAPSIIVYDVPPNVKRFTARAGLDDGGTTQQNGRATSVRFLVFTEKPPASLLAKTNRSSNASASASRDPEDAVNNLNAPDDLQATLFAAEPTLKSPSNIDVDHLGRVWVCEIVNYRHFRNKNNPVREEGDRILILEDTDGDGKADETTVFYQGRDIDSAHGICVLATPSGKNTKAIVSAGDSVFIFTDKNGDGKADKKDVLFTGISGVQHDHGIHAFIFGPDGRLYFNFGNAGRQIKDADGKPIVDKAGNVVADHRKPYQQGMVFRCNPDGTEFETLAWNFRNNWEVTVDSFGNLWQSDNDDDGNRGVRINFVMEYGNYGYRDELTGAGWRSPRTGMHPEVPSRHWHQNDPGVVPDLLQTGAGSPTGICVYEGRLLPQRFHNQLLHCDAGPNVVRSYAVSKNGAGYSAKIHPILTGTRDKWFRPSDVCVAPDGSLFIADWYDPGVGGHRQGDVTRGRIFRIAPPDTPYKVPKHDFTTTAGLITALKSPNLATRYIAWTELQQRGLQAEQPLRRLFENRSRPRLRARALWVLGNIPVCGEHYVEQAITDKNPDIRITALRIARQNRYDLKDVVNELVHDPSPQVRRECAIALRELDDEHVPELWAQLALQHTGKDRWSLEALGIGARGRWDACLTAWLKTVGDDWNTPAGRDIIWRSRSTKALPLLEQIILNSPPPQKAHGSHPVGHLLRYFRAFDFIRPESPDEQALKQQTLLRIATAEHEHQTQLATLALKHLGAVNLDKFPKLKPAVHKVLDASKGTAAYVQMVSRLNLSERYSDLLGLAQKHSTEQLGVEAMRTLLAKQQFKLVRRGLSSDDEQRAVATAVALGNSADGRITKLLKPLVLDSEQAVALRRAAVRAMAKTRNGARQIIQWAQQNKLDKPLRQAAAASLHSASWNEVKAQAQKLFPLPASKNNNPLPPISELLKRRGNVVRGRIVFNTVGTCAKCHKVNGMGKEVGPDLSEIGKKLSRKAMFESILFPSAGISHNYETYVVALSSGNTLTGLITNRTPDSITLKGADAIQRKFKRSDIELMRKQNVSLMPADLQKSMTAEQLVDVVEYMLTLKKAAEPKRRRRSPTGTGHRD